MDAQATPEFAKAMHREVLRMKEEYHERGDRRALFTIPAEQDGQDTVDFTKADPDCDRCNGTGIVDKRPVHSADGPVFVEVICSCVYANGGVDASAIENQFRVPVGRSQRGKVIRMHKRTWAKRRRERRNLAKKAKRR